jgi:hypothetical protein
VGGFSPKSDIALPTSTNPNFLALGDLNGEGKLDLVLTSSSLLEVLIGNGAGGFGAPSFFGADVGVRELKLADMTGDGRLDVVLIGDGSGQVRIFPGNGADSDRT